MWVIPIWVYISTLFSQYRSIVPFINNDMIQLTYFHLNVKVQMIHLHLYILK